jgi:hypothetical protein
VDTLFGEIYTYIFLEGGGEREREIIYVGEGLFNQTYQSRGHIMISAI